MTCTSERLGCGPRQPQRLGAAVPSITNNSGIVDSAFGATVQPGHPATDRIDQRVEGVKFLNRSCCFTTHRKAFENSRERERPDFFSAALLVRSRHGLGYFDNDGVSVDVLVAQNMPGPIPGCGHNLLREKSLVWGTV